MKRYEDDCCNCATDSYPCTGEHKCVPHYYCDKCKDEFEPEALYVTDDGDLCAECVLKQFETVAQVEEQEGYL